MKEKGICQECGKERVIYCKNKCQKCYRQKLNAKEKKDLFSIYIGKSARIRKCAEMIIQNKSTNEICKELYYSPDSVYRIKRKWIRERS